MRFSAGPLVHAPQPLSSDVLCLMKQGPKFIIFMVPRCMWHTVLLNDWHTRSNINIYFIRVERDQTSKRLYVPSIKKEGKREEQTFD